MRYARLFCFGWDDYFCSVTVFCGIAAEATVLGGAGSVALSGPSVIFAAARTSTRALSSATSFSEIVMTLGDRRSMIVFPSAIAERSVPQCCAWSALLHHNTYKLFTSSSTTQTLLSWSI